MAAEVIFTTVHGSRLYGFDHAGSDHDTFVVTTSRSTKPEHTIDGADDRVVMGINRFLLLAMSGSHQSVEALYSPVKEWTHAGRVYRPLISAVSVYGGDVFEKYERTIRKFCYGDFKRRRHAVRLSLNLRELREFGRLESSELTQPQVMYCNGSAKLEGDELAHLLNVYKEAK